MSTIHVLEISDIKCSGLRSADFLSKNDVYVVFKVGTKKCKTKYIPGSGKNVRFPETLVMNLSDADMAQGVDMVAYDYDFGSSDDMLGVGKLTNLEALKRCPDQPRGFETKFLYKGKARGEGSCVCKLRVHGAGAAAPRPGAAAPSAPPLGAVGGQLFNAAMAGGSVAQVVPAGPAQQYMTVTCPANARAGMQVIVQSPDGQRLQIVIPGSVGPGMQFRVPLPSPKPAVGAVVPPPQQYQAPPPQPYQQPYQQQQPQYQYGAPPPPSPSYGAPPPQYGQQYQQPQYGQQPYGQQPPPQYQQQGAPPPQYQQQGAPPPQYQGAPPPQYQQPPPPQYQGAPPPQYGAPPPQYQY